MRQTTYITLNLQTPNYATVYAARDNLLSRYVSATLLDGAAPWTPPAGTYAEISYIKPDGTGGYYDTVEDGSQAYTITNNVMEFVLAQQALTVPGDVRMALDFFNADGDSLSTFTFVLTVPENSFPYAQLASGNYFNVMQATLAEMAQYIKTLQDGYGAPLVASTVADMTDKTRVYVYTGSETGYTKGNWYYWDGSAWVSGGIYNSTAFTTDKTLTISGAAADAAAVGTVIDRCVASVSANIGMPDNLFDVAHVNTLPAGSYLTAAAIAHTGSAVRCVYVPIKPDTTYTVYKLTESTLRITTCNDPTLTGDSYSQNGMVEGTEVLTITSRSVDAYLIAQIYIDSNASALRSIDANAPYLYVYEGLVQMPRTIMDELGQINIVQNAMSTDETVDWTAAASTGYPTGWGTGYYNSDTGAAVSSNNYLRWRGSITPGKVRIIGKAPVGYHLCAYEYNGDNYTGDRYGAILSGDGFDFVAKEGCTYRFALGRFAQNAGTYLTNEFVANIQVRYYPPDWLDYVPEWLAKLPKTGTYEFFAVDVERPLSFGGEDITTSTESVECVLRLPDSYTQTGTPTRLILACHGASGYISASDNTWYNSDWKGFMDYLLAAGYAVFDCNVLPTTAGTDYMGFCAGSALALNVAKKAYDYIQRRYNVYREIFAHGTSMGGVLASAFANAYPGLVLAESSFAGRDLTQYIWRLKTETATLAEALAWGYESIDALKADKWSHIVGTAPSLSLHKYVDGVLQYPPDRETAFDDWVNYYTEVQEHQRGDTIGQYTAHRTVPYKAWDSWGDVQRVTQAKLILQKAFTNGSSIPCEVVVYETATHTQLSYGQVGDMRAQLIAWYKRWE